jgi:hypothetical protein
MTETATWAKVSEAATDVGSACTATVAALDLLDQSQVPIALYQSAQAARLAAVNGAGTAQTLIFLATQVSEVSAQAEAARVLEAAVAKDPQASEEDKEEAKDELVRRRRIRDAFEVQARAAVRSSIETANHAQVAARETERLGGDLGVSGGPQATLALVANNLAAAMRALVGADPVAASLRSLLAVSATSDGIREWFPVDPEMTSVRGSILAPFTMTAAKKEEPEPKKPDDEDLGVLVKRLVAKLAE